MGKNNPDARRDRREPYNQPIKIYGESGPRAAAAALRLAALGGTQPKLKAPRRRRSKDLGPRLIALVRRLKKIQAAARKLGLFVEDRELLTCPRCGLQEDIAIDGRLLVTVSADRHCDTGLRFTRVMRRGDWWRCPNCKSVLKAAGTK